MTDPRETPPADEWGARILGESRDERERLAEVWRAQGHRSVPRYIYAHGSAVFRNASPPHRDVRSFLRSGRRCARRITTIIVHSTGGGGASNQPLPARTADSDLASHHRVDEIIAHFVVLPNGTVVYTHDVDFALNDAGGAQGIDIEFAGSFPNDPAPPSDEGSRLTRDAILAGRALIYLLVREYKDELGELRHIHPHGQVQSGSSGKRHSCPGPDVWVNVGLWAAGRELGLICETTARGYPNHGISSRQANPAYDQAVAGTAEVHLTRS